MKIPQTNHAFLLNYGVLKRLTIRLNTILTPDSNYNGQKRYLTQQVIFALKKRVSRGQEHMSPNFK